MEPGRIMFHLIAIYNFDAHCPYNYVSRQVPLGMYQAPVW